MKVFEQLREAGRITDIPDICIDYLVEKARASRRRKAGFNNSRYNGKKTHWIALLFTVKVDPQQVELGEPEKMEAIGWFPFDSLPSPLHSMFLEHFEIVKKSGFI